MKEQITDEQIIAFIEGERNEVLKKQLSENKELQARYAELKEVLSAIEESESFEVPAHIQRNFQQAIFTKQNKLNKGISWYQLAAAVALLIVGFGVGKFSEEAPNTSELLSLKKEILSLKEITMTSALQQYSASERIMAVNQIEEIDKTTPRFSKALINTLNSDDSPNVRYAALQALSNYIDDAVIRAELVKSLETQSDPLIQIALISILMEASEKSALVPIKDILQKKEISPEVKKQAQIALEILT